MHCAARRDVLLDGVHRRADVLVAVFLIRQDAPLGGHVARRGMSLDEARR